MSGCRGWREMIGAYVLGGLPEDQRTGLLAHMDGCPDCRADAAELGKVARALETVDPERPTIGEAPPPHLYRAVFSRIEAEGRGAVRSRRRIRVAGLVAAAALLIVAAALTFRSGGEVVDFASVPRGVVASAVLDETRAGVEVHLEVEGLEPGTYGVWMEGYGGDRFPAGTFEVTGAGAVEGDFLAAWRRDECRTLGVTRLGGEDVLVQELPPVSG